MQLRQEALEYHRRPPAGKLEIAPTKPCLTQRDLALAYTPGVAEPCIRIRDNEADAYLYTAKGNLVAVVTNGTAVLGLGDIGALAGKPVMEGKALLFKRFADIDAIDLEIDTHDPDAFVQTVTLLAPSFGGINLEDIKAPECFEIEERLKQSVNIPVFHDDQHGTAIISGAALMNALELAGKRIEDVRIVFSGAGAAAIATARFYLRLGASRERMILCDSHGVIHAGRTVGMNLHKAAFAAETDARTLADALRGADVFVGLSQKGVVNADMLRSMAPAPIVFAMANPDPEIDYDEARAARPDALLATGRSDYPNQVNNVLGFPFIFRGALDVRATCINEEMKVAAARALAALAREEVPDSVVKAYGARSLVFGPDYLIPKPLDSRILLWVAPAVAQAAIESGVARVPMDEEPYRERLESRLGKAREMMRIMINKAKADPCRLVLADGEHEKAIRAAHLIADERIAHPTLLGRDSVIRGLAEGMQVPLDGVAIVDPATSERREEIAERLLQLLCRRGVTRTEAQELAANPLYCSAVMVEMGQTDAVLAGLTTNYQTALTVHHQIVGTADDCDIVAGVYLVATRHRVLFFADTNVNADMDAEKLAQVAIRTARLVRNFDLEPRIAMLSFSNFGSASHGRVDRVREAVEIVRARRPDIVIDGEMQAHTALSEHILRDVFPFNRLGSEANVLIFPNLEAGNIGLHLVRRLANAEVVGPILIGIRKPVHILQRWDETNDVVNLAALAVVKAQRLAARARSAVPS